MPSSMNQLLHEPIIVINLGLQQFSEWLEEQDIEVVQVDWIPPAGGDKEIIDLLDELL